MGLCNKCTFIILVVSFLHYTSLESFSNTPDRQQAYIKCFAQTYDQARNAFLRAGKELEAQYGSEKVTLHAILHEAKGKDGEELATDILWIGSRKPSKVLFHSSGVHGVEGYVGSAIQIQLLSVLGEHKHLIDHHEDVAIVFIHAVNPYGMSWWRRWNSNNVDLNRNFLADEKWKSLRPNPGYMLMKEQMSKDPAYLTLDFFYSAAVIVAKLGYSGAAQAFAGGQYVDPKGVYFGGQEPQSELVNILSFLSEHFSLAQHYIAIDVHSGLGPRGHDMLMTTESKSAWAKNLGDHIEADDQKPKLYQLEGGFPEGLKAFFSSKANFTKFGDKATQQKTDRFESTKSFHQLTQEFGTKPGVLIANALYEENFLHQKGAFANLRATNLEFDSTKQKLRSAFYLSEDEVWREKVLTRGLWLFQSNLKFLHEQK